MSTPQVSNRLGREKSPYLLQHAYNPVEWYPWGDEAFERARREEKPVFLSIGYSTCHWCHVMAHESFEETATAELLNKHFVSIKVDREERPDVDGLYMQAVMQMAGQGGWPLSVFLTPDREPFYGGTYFPPESKWGHPGFKDLLCGIAQAWQEKRGEVLQSGRSMADALRGQEVMAAAGGAPVSENLIEQAFQSTLPSFDETYGGFLPAPKFPRSHLLSLFLRHWNRSKEPEALRIVEKTLERMAAGGIYDHLGGGFHRYSTDVEWHVPHFEKMLYDQALLSRTYLEAYQATGKQEYARTARDLFEYLLRDMTSPEGGFYSAEDADSEEPGKGHKREGAFYVWTAKEIQDLLGPDSELFSYVYGALLHGNAGHDPMGEFVGKNILYQAHSIKEAVQKFGRSELEIEQVLSGARKKLLEARAERPRPHLDDKVLADWNGLMISSLAFGAQVLDDARYGEAARRAAEFILKKMMRPDGRLLHRYREGESAIPGYLEDYAFFIHGLIDLYQANFDPKYLTEAKRLAGEMIRLFWDNEKGGFFMSGSDAEQLLVRQKELYDGAIPSGNSMAALSLVRAGKLTAEKQFEQKAFRLIETFSSQVNAHPSAFPQLLIALDFLRGPSSEIVLAGERDGGGTRQMIRTVFGVFLPNTVVALRPPEEAGRPIEELAPFVKGREMLEGKPTAYVCRNYACNLPVNKAEKLKELLRQF